MFRNLVEENSYGHHGHHGQPVKIRRGKQFEDAFDHFYKKNLKGRISVQFINKYGLEELGVDAGGLTKEFLIRVFKYKF